MTDIQEGRMFSYVYVPPTPILCVPEYVYINIYTRKTLWQYCQADYNTAVFKPL